MKLDVTQVLKEADDTTDIMLDQSHDLDPAGKVVLEDGAPRMKGGKAATLEAIISKALLAPYKGEEELALDKKMERWDLHKKIKDAALPVEISESEVTTIETLVNKLYGGVLIPARVREAITKAKALALEVQKADKPKKLEAVKS